VSGALTARVEALLSGAVRGDGAAALAARDGLVAWCRTELLPHAVAEEQALYPAAAGLDRGRLLVEGMLGEHRVLTALVEQLATARDTIGAAAAAGALRAVFGSHLEKENELVLPLLTEAPGISLAGLLVDLQARFGAEQETAGAAQAGGCGGHSCSCGEVDGPGFPELDARAVPHAIRHATIFGALDSVAPGGGLVLVAPHDPLPLLAQIQQRWGDAFAVSYLERGPEAWRLSFTRSR
jgi:uncharacterized protein (DUF2249 family)